MMDPIPPHYRDDPVQWFSGILFLAIAARGYRTIECHDPTHAAGWGKVLIEYQSIILHATGESFDADRYLLGMLYEIKPDKNKLWLLSLSARAGLRIVGGVIENHTPREIAQKTLELSLSADRKAWIEKLAGLFLGDAEH